MKKEVVEKVTNMRLLSVCIKTLIVFAFILVHNTAYSQERTVSGKVVDKDFGDGLPGTTVREKGTNNGTTTDIDGNYKLSLNSDNPVLVFSFVGFKTQEITVGARSVIDVQMASELSSLSEVVVVGYGTQEARDVTGSVNTVTPKDFNRGAIASPDNLITGKMPGVVVTPSAEPGGQANIVIRGATTIGSGQEPLIVVDGVPLDNSGYSGGRNALNFINPNDIESVTVLKDASATAIYGSRGAAGVIIYTTKSGKAGEPKVSYDGFYSVSQFNGDFGFLSPQNFRNAVNLKAPQRAGLMGNESTIWVDEVIQQVAGQSHNLSFSGGNGNTTYNMSVSHMQNNGVVRGSENNITRVNAKITSKLLNDNLRVTFNTKNAYSTDNFAPNVVGTALTYDPTQPIFDENSIWGGYREWAQGLAPTNPVSTLDQTINIGETRRSFSAIDFDWKMPIEGLTLRGIYSADLRNGKNQFFQPTTYRNLQRSGQLSNSTNQGYTFTWEQFLTYEKNFNNGLNFDAMLGYSFQEVFRETFGYFGWDLSTDAFTFNDPSVADELQPIQPFPTKNRLQSYFGRVNASLFDKYLLTVNFRADGSTRFGPGNRYGFFPSAAMGWRIIEEDFMQALTGVFSDMKIRAGYGITGNQAIGDYLYETFYSLSTSTARYQFGPEFYQMLRPVGVDPNIRWEQTETVNLGIDFSMARGRLNGFVDVYTKRTSDLLTAFAPPAFTNVSDVVITNVAEMVNNGAELSVSYVAFDNKDWGWDFNFNAAYNENRITKLDGVEDENSIGFRTGGISGDVGQTAQVLRVGQPINSFLLFNQLYGADGRPLTGSNINRYEDINGDGVINENDLVAQYQPAPIVTLGFTNQARYKNFLLDFTMRANIGNYVYNNTASAHGWWNRLIETNILNNIHESVLVSDFTTRQLLSNFYLENASFLRMDNITLSYNMNRFQGLNARFYTTVQNAFTITSYSGPNPEVLSGIDNNLFPLATIYIFGVNLTF